MMRKKVKEVAKGFSKEGVKDIPMKAPCSNKEERLQHQGGFRVSSIQKAVSKVRPVSFHRK